MSRAASFAIFLAVFSGALALLHGYVWLRLVRDPALPIGWRRALTAALVVLALAIPAAMFARRLEGALARLLPSAAFAWLGIVFLAFSIVLALDLVRMLVAGAGAAASWLGSAPAAPPDPERRLFVARAMAGTAAIATAGLGAHAVRRATGPAEVPEVPIRLERLPRALDGFTLAQITDLHVGPTIREREVRRVVEQTNAIRADAVVITGDLVDGSVAALGRIVGELARLRARHGVFFVTGNHDFYSGAAAWVAELRRLGITVLRNERAALGDAGASLDLAGVDDWSARRTGPDGTTDLDRALAGRDPERPLVLLAHQPRGLGEAVAKGVELQVSGHTHGGQIFPFDLLVRAAYPYVQGLYAHEEGAARGQIYVSRGTGYWGPPLRLGNPPEIAKLVLTAGPGAPGGGPARPGEVRVVPGGKGREG